MNGAGAILLKSGGAAYVPPKNGEDALFRRGVVVSVGLIRGENAG